MPQTKQRKRRETFMELSEVMVRFGGSWVVAGDFNTIRSHEEKVGFSFNKSSMRALDFFIDSNGLIDIPLSGAMFTWSNFRESATQCRLDRLLVSSDILQLLPNMKKEALPKSISDHNPILAKVGKFESGPRPFNIFNHWLKDVSFNAMLKGSFDKLRGSGINNILRGSKVFIKKWVSKKRSRCRKTRIKELENEIKMLELQLQKDNPNEASQAEIRKLRVKIWELLRNEEKEWKQKSRI
ncbi:hypothetical protein HRI_002384400 [Hibiscus trionum]|uniref:Endonuclease/exonuclease/phosphatase domain-containing protein n=1 Tax=Hibiscus trionum TaxID=183268 RepID=A0A9W7I1C7_HIBTR|nr:hypothetical protein HRI_002384400 [Hibiscus trionum]